MAKSVSCIPRRDLLKCGAVTVGTLSAGGVSRSPLAASEPSGEQLPGFGKAKSVILICLLGGPAQQESWDPKPDGPSETRGEFQAISSNVPGIDVSELMPLTAQHIDKTAVLRAVVTGDNAHSSSGYYMLTGVPHIPMNRENVTPQFPNRHPNLGAVVRSRQSIVQGLPSAIQLPLHIFNDGMITWPGQDAGWLGHQHDPWLIKCNPEQAQFRIPDLSFPEDVVQLRFDRRRSLKEQLDTHFASLQQPDKLSQFDSETQTAYELLASEKARQAFDLNREPASLRDKYGRTNFGQSTLLARRLVEAGAQLVQVNWTRLEGKENNGTWDTHAVHAKSMKEWLMPIMDQAYSALLADLADRGLLNDTLVVWMGEFGRTPHINPRGGRDHWGSCFSMAFAGGGVQGGQVIGRSDNQAAYPVSGVVRPEDYTACVLHALGISPDLELVDPLGRPIPASRGKVVPGLFKS